jgi:acyl-coenzyme A synthetase/AMP-(fatty) acid ligase
VAYVVKHPGSDATAEDIMEYVASQVAHFKQVRRVEFIEAIPKSPTGKLLRRQLKQQALGKPSS